jgi:hypothetical protein
VLGQRLSASIAQSGMRSVWHEVQAFGTPSRFVVTGEMNLKVWLRTLTHVAGDAAAPRARRFVLRVLLDGAAGSRLDLRPMALQADGVAG